MAETVSPTLDQVLAFCAEEPVERVFLEDIARRGLGRFSAVAEPDGGRLQALCHVGANVVPSGDGCAAFAEAAAHGGARMMIGEERAVGELWEAARPRDAAAARRSSRPARLRAARAAGAGRDGAPPGPSPRPRSAGAGVCRRASRGDRGRSAQARRRGVPLADAPADRGRALLALARGGRDPVQGRGVGVDAGGGAAAAGLGRPAGTAAAATRAERSPTCAGCCSSTSRPSASSCGPRTSPRLRLYDSIGMTRELTYRSLVF